MGTRCGNVDAAVIEYLMNKKNMTIAETISYLNKKSGMLGVSGVSSDFRDLTEGNAFDNPRNKLAVDLFAYDVKKYIGQYAAVMNGSGLHRVHRRCGRKYALRQKACMRRSGIYGSGA